MKHLTKHSWAMIALLFITLLSACKEDEAEPEVIASFTYVVDAADFKKITFTNAAQNFETLSWDFGDQSTLSAELNPVHTYAEVGTYTVTLTATSPKGAKDVYSEDITISDPNVELTKLVGDVSKTWKLLRIPGGGRYPMLVMPYDRSQVWWAQGRDNDEIANRPCIMNDSWTFGRDLTMVYDAQGDFWREGGYFEDDNRCDATTNMIGINGDDCSAWGSGNHHFKLTTGANPKLTAIGKGAFVGFYKVGTGFEYKVPQDSVEYNIVTLYDAEAGCDTLIVEVPYKFNEADANYGGIWQFVLVHYDNPNDEPPIPGPAPTAGFTYVATGNSVAFTNTTADGETYLWDFGDGSTSTEVNPTHSYAGEGAYLVLLTATNPNGTSSTFQDVWITGTALTDALLKGTWKIRADENSIVVGPGMGNGDWWKVSKAMLTSGTGTDDWTCITDDEFIFGTGTVYIYDPKLSVRNDGYLGATNGCVDVSTLTGNAAYFGGATHSYVFTPAAGDNNPTITFTNAPDKAAFIGFMKGYNGVASGLPGGENTDSANAPNGGSPTNTYEVVKYAHGAAHDYMLISVDISETHDKSAAWSMVLVK